MFEAKEADKLPPPPYTHWATDCATELIWGQCFLKGKLYSMSPTERDELQKLIDKIGPGVSFALQVPHMLPLCCLEKRKMGA